MVAPLFVGPLVSAPRHVARILRQAAIGGEPRTPGSLPSPPSVGGEANVPDVVLPADGSLSTATVATFPVARDAVEEPVQVMIERRAAELADARMREAGESAFAQAREEGFKVGHEAGMTRGIKDGLEAAQTEWAALAVRAQALIDSARVASEREAEASAELALHLTFTAMRKLFGETFASRAGVEACVRQALAHTDARTVVSIRVAPADAALLVGTASAPGLVGGLAPTVAIKADERVGLGGCMIETSRGMLDARIETQLDTLLNVLQTAYEARTALSTRAEQPS